MIEVSCGDILGVSERGCSKGTTVIVENLFANVPARRKFLKRDVTEAMAVTANVEKIALSHPEVAIKLICDGSVKLETSGERAGCVVVTKELAEILQMVMEKYTFENVDHAWTKLCYYYDYLGPAN